MTAEIEPHKYNYSLLKFDNDEIKLQIIFMIYESR